MKRRIPLIFLTIIILICFCACNSSSSDDEFEFEQLRWPTYENAKQIPIPKSTMADVWNCNDVRFEFYLADTTFEDYKAYVDECKAMGFTLDAIEQENRYYALSKAEYELTVEHQPNDIMFVGVVELRNDVEIKLLHANIDSANMYDLRIEIDSSWEDDSEIGDEAITFDSYLKEGNHTLLIENDDNDNVNGRIDFYVTKDTKYLEFEIKCLTNKIEINSVDERIVHAEQIEDNSAEQTKTLVENDCFTYSAYSFKNRFEEAFDVIDGYNYTCTALLDNDKLITDEDYYLYYRVQDVNNDYVDVGMISFVKPNDKTLPVIDEFTTSVADTVLVLIEDESNVSAILVASLFAADSNLEYSEAYAVAQLVLDSAGDIEGVTYNSFNYALLKDEYHYVVISTVEKGEIIPPSSLKNSTTNTSTTPKKEIRYCEVSGCTSEGINSYIGLSSATEYYCDKHYKEIINMMSAMEEDVGKSSYSKHTCEECSREGTNSIIGISGQKEYYCSTHYKELQEFMEIFG